MKRTAILLAGALAASPAAAEDGDVSEGLSLLERGTAMVLQGLIEEIGPELQSLVESIESFQGYYPPEVLPNGDILIRRRPDADTEEAPLPDPETGEIEL